MNDQLYRQQMIDHYKNPRNSGILENPDYKGTQVNRSCGDEIEVFLVFNNDKLTDIKYEAVGCAVSIASASLLSEELIGMSKDEIQKIGLDFIEELIGSNLTTSRVKCATLALDAVKHAISKASSEF